MNLNEALETVHEIDFASEVFEGILSDEDVKAIETVIDTVEDIQPVVHAKWFLDGNSSSEEEKCYRCSNCKAVLEEDYKWHNHNYCYHCGAKMDEKEATYIKDIFMTR